MIEARVVAVGGPSGSGKSALVRALARGWAPAEALFFDDYPVDGPDPAVWLAQRPLEFAAWRTPAFALDLGRLRAGHDIAAPASAPSTGMQRRAGERLRPTARIVIEEPYGRLRPEMAGCIDFVVALELPLEVALARRLSRQLRWARATRSEADFAAEAEAFLDFYLSGGAEAYAEQMEQVSVAADLVLDARRPTASLAAEVLEVLTRS